MGQKVEEAVPLLGGWMDHLTRVALCSLYEAALGETSSHSRNIEHWRIFIAETACTAEVDRGGRSSVDG